MNFVNQLVQSLFNCSGHCQSSYILSNVSGCEITTRFPRFFTRLFAGEPFPSPFLFLPG